MPVQSTNPEYDAHLPEWQMMDDALEGECAITRNDKYLPKPTGMVEAENQSSICCSILTFCQPPARKATCSAWPTTVRPFLLNAADAHITQILAPIRWA